MAATNSLEIQRHALDYWQIVRNRFGLITLVLPLHLRRRGRAHLHHAAQVSRAGGDGHRAHRGECRVVGNNAGDPLNLAGTENFLKTQFEIITKRRTLDRVVEKYDLVNRWKLSSRQAAAGKLLANLDAQSSIKSDFVVIEYYDEDPQLAAELANAIADSYKETRLETENARINSAIAQLDIQITAKVKDARKAFDRSMQLKREGECGGTARQRDQPLHRTR